MKTSIASANLSLNGRLSNLKIKPLKDRSDQLRPQLSQERLSNLNSSNKTSMQIREGAGIAPNIGLSSALNQQANKQRHASTRNKNQHKLASQQVATKLAIATTKRTMNQQDGKKRQRHPLFPELANNKLSIQMQSPSALATRNDFDTSISGAVPSQSRHHSTLILNTTTNATQAD